MNHESMHHVWSVIEWLGNSLIFLLAGLIFGDRTLETVEAIDWAHLFVLYIPFYLFQINYNSKTTISKVVQAAKWKNY